MASIKKRGALWRVQLKVNGIRDSSSFATKAEAKQWAAERETQIRLEAANKNNGIETTKTIQDAFDKCANEISSQKDRRKWEIIRMNLFAKQ